MPLCMAAVNGKGYGYPNQTDKGRQGWYVHLDFPRWVRQRKGSSASIRFKGGATEAEAKRNCLSIEAKQLKKWDDK